MLKKMLFAFASAATLALSAAPVFELKFENGKANWGKIDNFRNRLKIEDKAFAGAKMASVATNKDPKLTKCDTSFGFLTPAFDVTGKKVIKVTGEVYGTVDLRGTGNSFGQSIGVLIPGEKGKKNRVIPFGIQNTRKAFTKFSKEIKVTPEMKKVQVQLGYDWPDLLGQDAFAVKSLKVEVE